MINRNIRNRIVPCLVFACFALTLNAQSSYLDWFFHGGGPSNDVARGVCMDNYGYIYFVSEVSDTMIFPNNTIVAEFSDICLTKLNPAGEVEWMKIIGGSGLDRGYDVKTDANDDVIITGFFSGTVEFGTTTLVSSGYTDVYVAKYNSNGVFQWAVHGAGSKRDRGICIALDNLNGIYVGGYFESNMKIGSYTLSSSGTYETLFYTKISSNGTVLWAKQARTLDYSESQVQSICFDGSDVVLTGTFDDTMIFGDDTLRSYDGSDDIFMAKIDVMGSKVWLKQYGGDYDDSGDAIISDGFGNLFLAGSFRHTVSFGDFQFTSTDNNGDVFIAGLDSEGNFKWADHGSGKGFDYPTSMSYNTLNGLTVCGVTREDFKIGSSDFAPNASDNIFIANYFKNGTFKNAIHINSVGSERVYDICTNQNNIAYIVGSLDDSMKIADTVIVAHYSLTDLFVAKINMNSINTSIENPKAFAPDEFSLLQNYPNPFTEHTKIRWQMPKSGRVTLKVFDARGKEVAVLVNEVKPIGTYEFNLDTSKFPPGVYFYYLSIGKNSSTKKMISL